MLHKIKATLQADDIKRLVKNFFSLSILKLANAILPLVTLPYLIKVLGLSQYGAIVLALSLVAYFQSFTDYGFNLSATRDIARHKSSLKQLSYIYSRTIISKIYLLLFSLIVLIPLILLVPQFSNDINLFLLMSLVLIGRTLFPEWFFRGVEQMGYITILDLIVKASFTIGVFSLIKEPADYWLYPALLGLSYIIIAIVSNYIIIKNFKLNLKLIKISSVTKNLKISFPLFINQFMPNFYNTTTSFMVGMILGKQVIGLLGAVREIINILGVFNSVVSTVVFPYLIRHEEKFYIFSKIYIVGFLVISMCFISVHKFIFDFLNIVSPLTTSIFLILVSGISFIVVYSIYSTNFLIPRGYDKIVMYITVAVSLFGFLTAYPLIIRYGVIGGAINIAFAQFLMGSSAFTVYRIVERKNIPSKIIIVNEDRI